MQQLRIYLFGGLEIRSARTLLPAFPTQKSKSLFAYLVLNRDRLVHREILCGQFWGDRPECVARKALRTALWRIRSVIEPDEAERGAFLEVEAHQVGFRASDRVWVDVWEFEESMSRLGANGHAELDQGDIERLARAASLYRGDFLEGHYDEWCLVEQDRLRLAYLTILERLVAHNRGHGYWLEAITVGKQLLRRDPLREHIHRAVMECHLAMGDRPSALRQYESCVHALQRELEIEPMEETRKLYERIRDVPPAAWNGLPSAEHGKSGPAAETGGIEHFAAEVDGALAALYALAERLQRARTALEYREAESPHHSVLRLGSSRTESPSGRVPS